MDFDVKSCLSNNCYTINYFQVQVAFSDPLSRHCLIPYVNWKWQVWEWHGPSNHHLSVDLSQIKILWQYTIWFTVELDSFSAQEIAGHRIPRFTMKSIGHNRLIPVVCHSILSFLWNLSNLPWVLPIWDNPIVYLYVMEISAFIQGNLTNKSTCFPPYSNTDSSQGLGLSKITHHYHGTKFNQCLFFSNDNKKIIKSWIFSAVWLSISHAYQVLQQFTIQMSM